MDAYQMNAITVIEWILFLDFFFGSEGWVLPASMRSWVALFVYGIRVGKLISCAFLFNVVWLGHRRRKKTISLLRLPRLLNIEIDCLLLKSRSSFPVYSLVLA